jgi:hypothetical protein
LITKASGAVRKPLANPNIRLKEADMQLPKEDQGALALILTTVINALNASVCAVKQ